MKLFFFLSVKLFPVKLFPVEPFPVELFSCRTSDLHLLEPALSFFELTFSMSATCQIDRKRQNMGFPGRLRCPLLDCTTRAEARDTSTSHIFPGVHPAISPELRTFRTPKKQRRAWAASLQGEPCGGFPPHFVGKVTLPRRFNASFHGFAGFALLTRDVRVCVG